jgi:hypothetical protein
MAALATVGYSGKPRLEHINNSFVRVDILLVLI